MHYDVFNGDADGIFAIHQLRLANPTDDATLVTGVKRDIALLQKIQSVQNGTITVADVSLDKNRQELVELLQRNNRIFYIDHHYAGEIPEDEALEHHIESSATTCTSIIANSFLDGRFARWAMCGAYGDNLDEQANQLAHSADVSGSQRDILKEIGELFNYNGYGTRLEDLHFHPADLYRAVRPYNDPLLFHAQTDIVEQLRSGFAEDMARAEGRKNISPCAPHRMYSLPRSAWARRIAGVFSNRKAREQPEGAHAIIVENDDSTFQISVRAPLVARRHADTLCRQFPTGGGRAGAAGINYLPFDMLDQFTQAFVTIFTQDQ